MLVILGEGVLHDVALLVRPGRPEIGIQWQRS
jgi:hypothetical protein